LNTKDQVWLSVSPLRRSTLMTVKTIENNKEIHQFDIYMQGEKETVFFDV